MKCPGCGAEGKGKFCEYCGSELPQEKSAVYITNNYYGVAPQDPGEAAPAPREFSNAAPAPRRKTWLWVLGWIFMFPVPLTILMLRKKDMKPAVKYGIIAAAWIVYFVIGLSG